MDGSPIIWEETTPIEMGMFSFIITCDHSLKKNLEFGLSFNLALHLCDLDVTVILFCPQ